MTEPTKSVEVTMKERIARALAKEEGRFDPDIVQNMYLGKADAVLAAMMEPTDDMETAGQDQIDVFEVTSLIDAKDVWAATITAAKGE